MEKNSTKLIFLMFPKRHLFWRYLSFIICYTAAVVWFDDHYFPRAKFLEAYGVMSTTSAAVGLLLAFRTNSAYDRWWEGRKLWGQLINEIRNFWLKLQAYVDDNDAERERVRQLLIHFPHSLKAHLRGHEPYA